MIMYLKRLRACFRVWRYERSVIKARRAHTKREHRLAQAALKNASEFDKAWDVACVKIKDDMNHGGPRSWGFPAL